MTSRASTRIFPTTFFRPRGHLSPAGPTAAATAAAAAAAATHHHQPNPTVGPWPPLRERTILRDVHERTPDPSCGEGKAPDERTLRLGRTISILHERLPTLLASPLPAEILSPQIELDLFPSTHPHLPRVRGRLSYTAALWTAPVAWGRVPVLGNVRLEILSARMFNLGPSRALTYRHTHPSEKLVVRWRTCGRGTHVPDGQDGGVLDFLSRSSAPPEQPADRGGPGDKSEFTGLFIFAFDDRGRVATHTIEHAQQGGNWEKMTRVVSVTDWLLGLAKRRREGEAAQGLALDCAVDDIADKPASAAAATLAAELRDGQEDVVRQRRPRNRA